ncbi:hypothetical protein Tco_0782290 [Tanacetum coccineum]
MKTPMSSDTKLTKDEECESVDSTKYRGMIGSLLYLTASRPDIMFSVCLCARFQEDPKTSHLEAITTNQAYPLPLDTAYRSSVTEVEPKRHFKTLSLDELRSPDFNLLSDQEYSEEEVAKTMAETMEQCMSKTRAGYGSGVARPKIKDKCNFELKGQFLKELRTNTFGGSDHEDANEHIEKVLEIVDLFHIPNITRPTDA